MNHTSRIMLGTQRGYPVMYMNPDDMQARGLADDDEARLFNDLSEMRIRVRRSPGTKPGQVVIYNGYEPFQFKDWMGPENVEPGMVKWLHFAGGYGHLQVPRPALAADPHRPRGACRRGQESEMMNAE